VTGSIVSPAGRSAARRLASGARRRVRRLQSRLHWWSLLWTLTLQELRTRYRQSSLDLAWGVVQPAAMVGVYALFFGGVLRVDGGDMPYLSFIVAGIVSWRFFANGLGAATSITDNLNLISKVYFPREIIPSVRVLAGFPDLLVGTVALIVIAWVQVGPPAPTLLALPLVLAILVCCTAGVTIIVTTVAVFARDLGHAIPLVLQAAFFATPIMYPPELLPSWLQWLASVNPVAVVITATRAVVVEQVWPDWTLVGIHLLGSIALLGLAIAYIRSVEHRMVDLA